MVRSLMILLAAPSAFAHHSIAATYDPKQPVTIQGRVAGFGFMNPHSYVDLDAKEESGQLVRWRIEIAAVSVLQNHGWKRDTLKTGDIVTVSGYRAKSEMNRAVAGRVLLPDGRELESWPSGTMWRNPTEAEFLAVGRAPWSAADPLAGLVGYAKNRTRGSGADEGVRPTLVRAKTSET